MQQGLRPWQPRKVYQARWYGMFERDAPPPAENLVTVDGNVYDPLLGRTYAEIGSEARAMHKCQGFGQLLALPGPFVVKYKLVDTTLASQRDAQEQTLEDGLDMTVPGLARFAGASPPPALHGEARRRSPAAVHGGRRPASAHAGPSAALPASRAACAPRASCARWLASPGAPLDEDAAFEIDFRLAQTERKFEQALVTAQACASRRWPTTASSSRASRSR